MKEIRKATIQDLETILRLRDQARQTMQDNGNSLQWPQGYPTKQQFVSDIRAQHSYIIERNGQPCATFALMPSQEPTYKQIYQGQWIDENKPYYTIHRIAAAPESKGIFQTIVDYADTITDNIRIDTHKDNTIMQHLLHTIRKTKRVHLQKRNVSKIAQNETCKK